MSRHPALNDALEALAPPQRRSVIEFAKQFQQKNLSSRPKLDFDVPELLSGLTTAQVESAKAFAMTLLEGTRSAAYLKKVTLTELAKLVSPSQ
jgi:hypothetical protein